VGTWEGIAVKIAGILIICGLLWAFAKWGAKLNRELGEKDAVIDQEEATAKARARFDFATARRLSADAAMVVARQRARAARRLGLQRKERKD
jgi:hypothetical protein